jgi:hypothetical protein
MTQSNRPPSYAELADLVCELVETNIANLDGQHPFVTCFTFGGTSAPDHWHRAIAAREVLIESKLATRQKRKYDPSKVRPMVKDKRRRSDAV